MLSRNVGKELPLHAAQYPRRTHFSSTSRRKPKIPISDLCSIKSGKFPEQMSHRYVRKESCMKPAPWTDLLYCFCLEGSTLTNWILATVAGFAVLPQMFIFDCTSCSRRATERRRLAIGNDGTEGFTFPCYSLLPYSPFCCKLKGFTVVHSGVYGRPFVARGFLLLDAILRY
jgi:hypothetical protein